MKAIQVTVDEKLLVRLDRDPDVKRFGRSAVFRRAVNDYLRTRRRQTIADGYKRAYGSGRPDADLHGWDEEGVWPER